ncbi:MAG: STAS domain-containing protein [Pseudonocardiaceae bacterium]
MLTAPFAVRQPNRAPSAVTANRTFWIAKHTEYKLVSTTWRRFRVSSPSWRPCWCSPSARRSAVAQVVVVNLDGVRFLASAGLRALFEANERATQQDRDLRLVCNSWNANQALEAGGLREHLPFADDVPDACGRDPDRVTALQAIPPNTPPSLIAAPLLPNVPGLARW